MLKVGDRVCKEMRRFFWKRAVLSKGRLAALTHGQCLVGPPPRGLGVFVPAEAGEGLETPSLTEFLISVLCVVTRLSSLDKQIPSESSNYRLRWNS